MAWSGASFVRALGASQWANDAAAAVGIQAGIHDTQDNDLATGIDNCINKNGANTPTANLSMGGFIHTNVGSATARTNYPSVGQVQDGYGSWCGTSGGSANAQTLTPTPAIAAGVAGQRFTFIAGFTNTSTLTLNVSGLGAQAAYRPDGRVMVAGDITAGQVYTVVNDGASRFIFLNVTPKWVDYSPTVTGFSANPTNTVYRYLLEGDNCSVLVRQSSLGTSNSTAFTISAPFTALTLSNATWEVKLASAFDNSAYFADGEAYMTSGATVITLTKGNSASGWTNAGTKGANFLLRYQIA